MSDLDRIGEPSPKSVDRIAEEEEQAIISGSRRKTRVNNVKNWCYIIVISFFTLSIIVVILLTHLTQEKA
jgi:t-SNARE complex subunit (syntaxin)